MHKFPSFLCDWKAGDSEFDKIYYLGPVRRRTMMKNWYFDYDSVLLNRRQNSLHIFSRSDVTGHKANVRKAMTRLIPTRGTRTVAPTELAWQGNFPKVIEREIFRNKFFCCFFGSSGGKRRKVFHFFSEWRKFFSWNSWREISHSDNFLLLFGILFPFRKILHFA